MENEPLCAGVPWLRWLRQAPAWQSARAGAGGPCYGVEMGSSDFTIEKQRPAHLFKPGQSGNPAGRPKGARARLSEDFLRDLHEAWGKHGIAALERCASESPDVFVRTVAGLMPREATLDVDVNILASATNVLEAYRLAAGVLGTDPAVGLKRLRKIAPNLDIYDVGE